MFDQFHKFLDYSMRTFGILIFCGYFFFDGWVLWSSGTVLTNSCHAVYFSHHITSIIVTLPFTLQYDYCVAPSHVAVHFWHCFMCAWPEFGVIAIGVPYLLFCIKSIYDGLFGFYKNNQRLRWGSWGICLVIVHTLTMGWLDCTGSKPWEQFLVDTGQLPLN